MKHFLSWKVFLAVLCAAGNLASCKNDPMPTPVRPEIALDSETGIYTVKIGRSITIRPAYKGCDEAVYAWKQEGRVIATTPELTFEAQELGDYYFSLSAINGTGEAYAELRVSVVSLVLPQVSLAMPEGGYTILREGDLTLAPTVSNSDGTVYSWSLNGTEVSKEPTYTFRSAETGDFALTFRAANEDGADELTIPIRVCTPEELPFSWAFEQTTYNLSQGRRIRIQAWDIVHAFDAVYRWTVDGAEVPPTKTTVSADGPALVFEGTEPGEHAVLLTMTNAYGTVSQQFTVHVCPPEGTYKRTGGTAQWNRVYEFLAAPGQFVNEGYTATTMDEAATYAAERMAKNLYVSLGGFGGYLVVGFDHSIENDGSYNIQVRGNSFAGSSEPGVVWVMQDENGNGLPDDTWYELKGSEYGKSGELRDYAITYYRPKAPGMAVQWTDNRGKSGMIDYLSSHRQEYYYPAWVTADSYTLRGTCLPSNTSETTPGMWYNGALAWGYADNFSEIDRLTDDDNYVAAANGNHFRISDAVTFDGQPANLKYVDFVKVVTGVNCKAGWLGEISTEVFGVFDFNLLKNKN